MVDFITFEPKIKLPPAKSEVYCLSASNALVRGATR